jgi:rubrerythrin
MTLSGIDVGALSLMDALDLAVLIEQEAMDRYIDLAETLELHHTPEAARFFRWMAVNEQKHRDELRARRESLFGDRPAVVAETSLFEVEAPEFDEVRVFMTLREALRVALRAEQKARDFFAGTLGNVSDEGVRTLFAELCAEERHHEALVLSELAKAPPDPVLRQRDIADDPVAQ